MHTLWDTHNTQNVSIHLKMRELKPIIFVLTTLIFLQCQTNNDSSKNSNLDSESSSFFGTKLLLNGVGKSDIASEFSDWNISIFDNDSIIMLSTLKKDENGIQLNNRQFFGRLIKTEKYSYEIKVSKFMAIDGCNKPYYSYLDTDTIPFYIDSTLLSENYYWNLITNLNNDTLKIDKTTFLYKTDLKDNETEIIMTLIPSEESDFIRCVIKSGLRCGIHLTNRMNNSKYFLNRVNGEYELIIDRTIPSGMVGKECNYCIKRTKLEIK